MFLFGHIGITIGAARVCDVLLSKAQPAGGKTSDSASRTAESIAGRRSRLYLWLAGIRGSIGRIDYRLVLLGSLLPDLLDKPLFLLLGNILSLSGRGYAHTLLFNLGLLVSGLVLIKYRKSWMLVLSLSSLMHLVLDRIWERPRVLFWPLLRELPQQNTAGWVQKQVSSLSRPEAYIPEIIGLLILLFLAYRLVKAKGVMDFIKKGVLV